MADNKFLFIPVRGEIKILNLSGGDLLDEFYGLIGCDSIEIVVLVIALLITLLSFSISAQNWIDNIKGGVSDKHSDSDSNSGVRKNFLWIVTMRLMRRKNGFEYTEMIGRKLRNTKNKKETARIRTLSTHSHLGQDDRFRRYSITYFIKSQ